MPFQANVAMSVTKATEAIHHYRTVAKRYRPAFRVFSEPRTNSRKLKFFCLSESGCNALANRFTAAKIPFYTTSYNSIVVNVPKHVTMSARRKGF